MEKSSGSELGGNPRRRILEAQSDKNFEGRRGGDLRQFENTFMMYLPRLCEHCLNPACVSACPSGAIYKRDEDGVVS
jgi:nitrate reductase beta subunit